MGAAAGLSLRWVVLFILILGRALGLPEVENPIPSKIGLDFIVSLAGAGGILGGVLSLISWPRRQEQFISGGTFCGFCIGCGFYALSLIIQLASGS